MLQHKTELKQNDDGSVVIDVQLFGNQTELAAIALGKVNGGFVKQPEGSENPDQLDIRLVLKPVPLEVVTDEPTKEDIKKLEARARGTAKAHAHEDESSEETAQKADKKLKAKSA